MKKHYQKGIFLAAIAALALIIRIFYPVIHASLGGLWQDNGLAAMASSTAPALPTAPSLTSSAPAPDMTQGSTTTYYGEANTASSVFSRIATTAVPDFPAHASLVADLTTGTVLEERNADERWPTASLTKLMTATVIFDHLSTSTRITITPKMFAVYPQEETLKVNGTYTVEDLLHVMLMPSSNVAAEAMADFYGHAAFMAAMNQRAEQWGMKDTYFDDPSGLSSANQSSPSDFLILAEHIYKDYPGILAITDTPDTTITDLATDKQYDVRSINEFAGEPGFIGGKTGFTDEARDNLLSVFNYYGHPLLVVVLGVEHRFEDTTKLLNWFTMNYR